MGNEIKNDTTLVVKIGPFSYTQAQVNLAMDAYEKISEVERTCYPTEDGKKEQLCTIAELIGRYNEEAYDGGYGFDTLQEDAEKVTGDNLPMYMAFTALYEYVKNRKRVDTGLVATIKNDANRGWTADVFHYEGETVLYVEDKYRPNKVHELNAYLGASGFTVQLEAKRNRYGRW